MALSLSLCGAEKQSEKGEALRDFWVSLGNVAVGRREKGALVPVLSSGLKDQEGGKLREPSVKVKTCDDQHCPLTQFVMRLRWGLKLNATMNKGRI